MEGLNNCHDCHAEPGQPHEDGCDTEQCSVCGWQRLQCGCEGHDKYFSRWTGIWPCKAEAEFLGMDLNQFAERGYHHLFCKKPTGGQNGITNCKNRKAKSRM